MEAYYLVKVQETHEDDRGKIKNVTQQYLAYAVSVTDAEAKTYKLYEGSSVPFEVKSVTETKILEVI
jgi:hypothetical protein